MVYLPHIEKEQFPGCCGVDVLYDLPYEEPEKPYTQVEFNRIIGRCENYIQIAVLNHDQRWQLPYWKKNGFKVVSNTFVNKSSGQRLYVLCYTPPQKKLKKLTKRAFGR